jgi:SAM-dependent methyltransferase
MSETEFDQFADSYDADLQRALSASGEDKNYFARGRVDWTMSRLAGLGHQPKSVLDYGCGTGSATPFLLEAGIHKLMGVDISQRSIGLARNRYSAEGVSFQTLADKAPQLEFDLAYTNGVFHHIPPAERPRCLKYIYDALVPGGSFAFWENNPWNLGTKYVMSNCVFDKDAITLSPPEARALAASAEFKILGTDSLFYFPKVLSWFRRLEPLLSSLPFGGQYLVLCRK